MTLSTMNKVYSLTNRDFGIGGYYFDSYLGHVLEVRDGATDEVVERFTVEYILSKGIGEPPISESDGRDFDQEVKDTLKGEWSKVEHVKRTFSPLGE